MADGPFQRLRRFLAELKRRNVYQVAVTYAVVAFVVWQAANLLFPALGFPAWTVDFVIVVTLLGLPIALVVAWAFEVTPDGVRRTPESKPAGGGATGPGAGLSTGYKVLVGLGLVAAAVAGGWYLTGGGGDSIRDRSVAVLPFETLGADTSTTFTEGLHSGLITRLQHVAPLTVIARPSVMRYAGSDKPVARIAQELNARWIVTAAVQSTGDQVQVQPRLIDPRSGTERWSKSYRRDLTAQDVFQLQAEITRKITRSLQAKLSPQEEKRVARRPTEDLDAYRLYVQGRTHLDMRTETGMRRAKEFFHQALAQDSSYALAWAGLADTWTLLAWYGHVPPDTMLAHAPRAARRAVKLEPDLAEGYTALGHVQRYRGNMAAALRDLKQAVDLKPSYASANRELAELLAALGRKEQALRHARKAVNLSPRSPPNRSVLGWTYWWAEGPSTEALDQVRYAKKLEPGYAFAYTGEGLILSDADRHDSASVSLRQGKKRAQPSSRAWTLAVGGLAVVNARTGDTARAKKLLFRLERRGGTRLAQAMVHTVLGAESRAFRDLRAMQWSGVNVRHLRAIDVFDRIRGRPHYQQLLSEIYSEWGLRPTWTLPGSVAVSVGSESDD